MSHSVLVRVLAEDISEGSPCDPKGCAIARALSRTFGFIELWVAGGGFFFKKTGLVYPLPEEAQKFVRRFDNRLEVKPIEFQVEV